jgi:hypothetical protein
MQPASNSRECFPRSPYLVIVGDDDFFSILLKSHSCQTVEAPYISPNFNGSCIPLAITTSANHGGLNHTLCVTLHILIFANKSLA